VSALRQGAGEWGVRPIDGTASPGWDLLMPRASQMPRTRAVRAARTLVWFAVIVVVALGSALVRASGDQWLLGLAMFAAIGAVALVVSRLLLRVLDRLAARANAADLQALPLRDRVLPFGVVARDDGALALPTKIGLVVLTVVFAVGLLALGVLLLSFEGGVPAVVAGILVLALGLWLLVVAGCLVGSRITLTREGVRSTMRLRPLQYEWLEVPDLVERNQLIILKAAGQRSPRVWIRAGALEASYSDTLAMIRRQRGW